MQFSSDVLLPSARIEDGVQALGQIIRYGRCASRRRESDIKAESQNRLNDLYTLSSARTTELESELDAAQARIRELSGSGMGGGSASGNSLEEPD